jgi:hypothetical protein
LKNCDFFPCWSFPWLDVCSGSNKELGLSGVL